MTAVKSDTSKRLGALLLKGWAMLAENCPDCQVPLMKERGAEERLCVNCETTFMLDGQGLRPTNRSSEEVPHQAATHGAQEDQEQGGISDDGEDEESYDPRSDPRLGPFSSSSRCPADPAVSTAGPGGAAALAPCGPSSEAATGAREHAAGPSAPVGNGVGNGHGSTARPAASAPSADDVADRLSEKMLQGWALLDKYCPRCSTVLVRHKVTKRMFCVACDAWVVTEADSTQQQQQQQQQPSVERAGATAASSQQGAAVQQQLLPTAPAATAPPASSPPGSQALCRQQQQQQPAEAASAPQRQPALVPGSAQAQQHAPCGHQHQEAQASGAQGSSGAGVYQPGTALLVDIGRTVTLKLAEAQGLLERTPAVDTDKARAYVALMGECIDLLAKLRGTQGST